MLVNIYQIFYDQKTRLHVNPKSIPIDNTFYEGKPLTKSLESSIICAQWGKQISTDSDYTGVLSWKFRIKRGIDVAGKKNAVLERMEGDGYKHDVYSFFHGMHGQLKENRNMWPYAERWHPGITAISEEIFKRIGIEVDLMKCAPMEPIYMNAHVTRTEIYNEYVETLLKPFIEILDNDPDFQPRLNVRTSYKNTFVTKQQLLNTVGVPFYPMHPFIAERLFSTFLFLYKKDIKIKHLC